MPTTVQVHRPRTTQFNTYNVFDLLMNQELKTSTLKFRSTDLNAPTPGSLITIKSIINLAFVVESVVTDFNGVVEVNCISAWEFLKRRTWSHYSKRDTFNVFYDLKIYGDFFDWMNLTPNQRMGFDWVPVTPYGQYNTVDVDPSTSVYDAVCDSIAGKNYALTSTVGISPSKTGTTPVHVNIVNLDNNNAAISIGSIGFLRASFTRRLPENPTHWTIKNTLDSGSYKVSSRGNIRTWKQNHAYMFDNHEYSGPYRYETGIEGDSKKQWGPITIGIKTGELKTSVVEVDKLSGENFENLTIGRPVSFSALGMYVTGYVISRSVSGGQITNYSVKIQPDHFYEEGRDVTGEWM